MPKQNLKKQTIKSALKRLTNQGYQIVCVIREFDENFIIFHSPVPEARKIVSTKVLSVETTSDKVIKAARAQS